MTTKQTIRQKLRDLAQMIYPEKLCYGCGCPKDLLPHIEDLIDQEIEAAKNQGWEDCKKKLLPPKIAEARREEIKFIMGAQFLELSSGMKFLNDHLMKRLKELENK